MALTVAKFSGNTYRLLRYMSNSLIKGKFVTNLCNLLKKCGIDIDPVDEYNKDVEDAVKSFQEKSGLDTNGVVNDSLLQAIKATADAVSDVIDPDDSEENITTGDEEEKEYPKYNSFFSNNRDKIYRLNNKDIVIEFGNKTIQKKIKNVYMRSVSVEVDTSGNPVSEVYEFIAQDIVESDELTDFDKYGINDISDITNAIESIPKTIFPYSSTENSKNEPSYNHGSGSSGSHEFGHGHGSSGNHDFDYSGNSNGSHNF